MPTPQYHLIDDSSLDGLILNYPGLTQERRTLIAAHLRAMTPQERDEVFNMYASSMPREEFDFVKECFGLSDVHQPLASLEPTEVSLYGTEHGGNRA